ncbi:MAG: signal recognition particle-docking protein FtsY [Desulfosudaceae bacterium]
MALNFFRRKKKQKNDFSDKKDKIPESTTDSPESIDSPEVTDPRESSPETAAASSPEPGASPEIESSALSPGQTPEQIPDLPPELDLDQTIPEQASGPEEAGSRADSHRETPPPESSPEDHSNGPAPSSGGLYQRLRQGLSKTRQVLTTDIETLLGSGQSLDEDALDDLEERLITSDIGVQPATEIIEALRAGRAKDAGTLKSKLKEIILSYLVIDEAPPRTASGSPRVIMVVGVNGVGKTTTIGKLAATYRREGKSVLLVAADTFRAAAIEQLDIWGERTGATVIKHKANSDPAAVVFDGLEAARARNIDIVIIDTAGRLHTKTNLMEELKKVKRTITKKIPDAPHEILLVLDATTGQNALSQVRTFSAETGVTGIILTKLDGTAKGGIAVNLCYTFQIPLQYVGVGEQVDDLQPFEPEKFIEALL